MDGGRPQRLPVPGERTSLISIRSAALNTGSQKINGFNAAQILANDSLTCCDTDTGRQKQPRKTQKTRNREGGMEGFAKSTKDAQ
jgi:hypothetical protein